MVASCLPKEIVDLGIQLKCILKNEGYESEARSVDYFLCQYNCINVSEKEELIDSMLITFNWRSCVEMFISDETSQCIEKYRFLLMSLKNEFDGIGNGVIKDE